MRPFRLIVRMSKTTVHSRQHTVIVNVGYERWDKHIQIIDT